TGRSLCMSEHRGSCDQNTGTRGGASGGVVRVDAPVDLHLDGDPLGRDLSAELAHLSKGTTDQCLSAEAGVDGDNQRKVHGVEDVIEGRGRSAWVDCAARAAAQGADAREG